MRSYSLLESIVQDENIDVVDLMLYPQDKLISRSISAIAEEIEENYNCEDPEEMIHFVNSIQYTTPPVLTTSLHSYNSFKAAKKYPNREKNVLKPSKVSLNPITLPSDTLLLSIAVHHPVTKLKTQEWLFTIDKTLEDIHNNIQCLSNYCTFSTPPGPIFFKFEEKFYKNLDVVLSDITVSVGALCTYSHRGMCQHDLIVTDVRLICDMDPQDSLMYPFQIFACKNKRRVCEVCERLHAKFIVMRDNALGVPYIYLCEDCLGNNSQQNEIYPYVHD